MGTTDLVRFTIADLEVPEGCPDVVRMRLAISNADVPRGVGVVLDADLSIMEIRTP